MRHLWLLILFTSCFNTCLHAQPTSIPAPSFLSYPYSDNSIRIQQGFVYQNGTIHDPEGAIDYIKGNVDGRKTTPFWATFDVLAAADGVATWDDDPNSCPDKPNPCHHGFGNVVIIRHNQTDSGGDRYYTLYAHLADNSIPTCTATTPSDVRCIPKLGRLSTDYAKWGLIKRGDLIGQAGGTGDVCDTFNDPTCIHLHFQIFRRSYSQEKHLVDDAYRISDTSMSGVVGKYKRDHYPGGSSFFPQGCGTGFLWIGSSLKTKINGNPPSIRMLL